MEELRDMLEQTILFYEKYDIIDTPIDTAAQDEFWCLEEMNTVFTFDNSKYVVYQVWSRNLFNSKYNITVYKDNTETTLDIFFIRTLLANLNRDTGAL